MKFLIQILIIVGGVMNLLLGVIEPISWGVMFIIFGFVGIGAEIIIDRMTWYGIPEKQKVDEVKS